MMKRFSAISNQLDDTNRLLYYSMKDAQLSRSQTSESLERIAVVESDLHTLSTGLQIKLQRDAERAKMKHYPKPDEAKMITATINEQIMIQAVLRSEQQVPIRGALDIITQNTMRTYPDVSEDYLINKCIAVVQDYNINRDN